MRILLTGVAGFIGSHVSNRLVNEGHEVIGVDDLSSGKIENINTKITFIKADLADSESFKDIPLGCKVILHLAGQSSGEISFDNPVLDLEKNVVSTLNLIKYGVQSNSRRIVYASSMAVYGTTPDMPTSELTPCEPLSCYGVSKLAAEHYLRIYQKKLPYTAMRMFNVYGPGQDLENLRQGMVSIYLTQALRGCVLVKGSLHRYRDFIYIDDVVESWYRACLYDDEDSYSVNIGTGHRVEVVALLEMMKKKIPGMSWRSDGSTPGDQNGIYADNSLMKRRLGIKHITSLEEGINNFINWASLNLS
jgi:UDP-glucose 4-epimerase